MKAPGLYPNVPMSEYQAWKAVSNSLLGHMQQSPAHLFCARENPRPPTPAMKLGSAVHAAVLEAAHFGRTYVRMPDGIDRRTKAGKEEYQALIGQYGEDCVLPADEYDRCIEISRAVFAHRGAMALLEQVENTEISGIWTDPLSSVTCKMRIDGLGKTAVIDLKTTTNASELAFTKTIANFSYHRQGAMYLDGLKALGREVDAYCIIAVEKDPPYGVAVYRLDDGAIAAGRAQYEDLLHKYACCEKLGEWPCYPNFVQTISIPEWAFRQMEAAAA